MFLSNPRTRQSGIIPNGPKVREALLHVIRDADSRGFRVTQYEVLKTLFFADRAHLNKYGRPITFDEYVAMPDGPVPSLAYDVLKDAISAKREAEIDEPLWSATPADGRKVHFHDAVRDASDQVLSESDREELSEALTLAHRLGFKGIWDKTHADKAYIKAWAQRGTSKQHFMEVGELFDEADDEATENVKIASALG